MIPNLRRQVHMKIASAYQEAICMGAHLRTHPLWAGQVFGLETNIKDGIRRDHQILPTIFTSTREQL